MTSTPPSADGPSPAAPRSPVFSSRLFRLARKELTEILRDRRTIVTLVVMPLLLYPLLTVGFGQVVLGTGEAVPVYRVGFVKKDQERLERYLDLGLGKRRPGQPDLKVGVVADDDIDAAVRENLVDVGFRPPPAADLPRRADEWDLVYREDSPLAQDVVRYLEQLAARADANGLRMDLKHARA